MACSSLQVSSSFDLPDHFSQNSSTWFVKGNQTRVILENDELEYPINLRRNEASLRREWFSLVRFIDGNVIENCFDKVQLVRNGDAESGYHSIKLDGLAQGLYELKYLNGTRFVRQQIEVLKGKPWEVSDNFILKDNSLIERLAEVKLPCISKLDLVEGESEHAIRVEADQCSKSA